MNTFFKEAINLDDLYGDSFKDLANQENNPFSPKNMDYNLVNNYQSVIYILSVPISALSTWIAYYVIGDRRYNFTEHIVLNLYYSAQIIIVSSILNIAFLAIGANYLTISTFVTLLTFIYLFFVLHRVYKTSLLDSFARFLLVGLIYAVFFVIIIFIAAIVGLIVGYLM